MQVTESVINCSLVDEKINAPELWIHFTITGGHCVAYIVYTPCQGGTTLHN
jgi:hypothetical protein